MKIFPNDIVDYTVKGVRVVGVLAMTGEVSTIADEHGNEYPVPPQAAVTRVAPAEWPPRTGDLWRDANGMLYLGMQPFDDGRVEVVNVGGDYVEADELLHRKPTLVHREGEQDGEEPGEVAEPSAYGLALARAARESGGRS
jgi:hypothetical protein